MIKEFLEGETYRNAEYDYDIMVLAVAEETEAEVLMAVLWVEKEGFESVGSGEITINKEDFKDWQLVEF